ncbi:ribosomal protein S6 kinase-like 1 (predicted), isoform CRA_c [Rattus norvegicus]|uniref:Ribosomal protein S6 kinase-like 1 (Predicted), isoform CRA_c n=1 Tax=Rattus norvegicus TaxID=10116 RepID=A6JE06_RAT|nr:ribosomal protein S6 kinase-like 1 (predicted), isoform CRA_c [Rattus norvegicus]EDL81552.1 ribosomal protein S6 kinase-like 1 (predicted), isoform CRA_c [Rattus norvegicus]
MVSRERLTIIPHGVPFMTKLLRYFVSEDSIFLHLEHVQGGTLWSHLLSQDHFQHSGLKSGSAQEKCKVQLSTGHNLTTPAKLPPGHTLRQDRTPVEPPWTSQSLPPALQLQKEADGEPAPRTSIVYSSDLTEAPCGHLHSQVRRAGQSSNPAPSQRLHWVREGADRVLGAYGRGRAQNPPSANRASLGSGRAAWSLWEGQVKQWAAEMLLALEALHEQGVLCRDLNPQNLLLDQAEGHIQLTYFGQWSEVEPQCSQEAVDCLYSAPGKKEALSQSHPSGFQAHTQLQLPEWLSRPAASLLTELLQFDPQRRLGAGGGGTSKLKSHPFFSSIQWSRLTG